MNISQRSMVTQMPLKLASKLLRKLATRSRLPFKKLNSSVLIWRLYKQSEIMLLKNLESLIQLKTVLTNLTRWLWKSIMDYSRLQFSSLKLRGARRNKLPTMLPMHTPKLRRIKQMMCNKRLTHVLRPPPKLLLRSTQELKRIKHQLLHSTRHQPT